MAEHSESGRGRKSGRGDRPVARRVARWLEWIGGAILCALIIATPWLFGTTENWSVRLMNIGSLSAGALLLAAAICNRLSGRTLELNRRDRLFQYLFLALNLAVLAFCVIALWNARATFSVEARSFDYRNDYNPRLPTTYDADLTRDTLISLAACCVVFWSLRYWLARADLRRRDEAAPPWRNKRFQTLVWILSLNGFALAIQGILQRLSGSAKLLWFRDSWWGAIDACFGPFSYRGNAAEYLNLIWPVALGFWWILSRERRRRTGSSRLFVDGPELLLIPATIVMIAGSVSTLSRGGAVVAVGILFAIALLFEFQKNISRGARVGVAIFVLLTVGLVGYLGWGTLLKRFQATDLKNMSGRPEIYKNAKLMTQDYPLFGTGPGSFRSVYHLYRAESAESWHGFCHDDWLETRATFGWVGFSIVLLNLLVFAAWVALRLGDGVPDAFMLCVVAGLLGALVHAKFDFPFQTYSILFTFVVLCSLLTAPASTKENRN